MLTNHVECISIIYIKYIRMCSIIYIKHVSKLLQSSVYHLKYHQLICFNCIEFVWAYWCFITVTQNLCQYQSKSALLGSDIHFPSNPNPNALWQNIVFPDRISLSSCMKFTNVPITHIFDWMPSLMSIWSYLSFLRWWVYSSINKITIIPIHNIPMVHYKQNVW